MGAIFQSIFLNENYCILIKISLKNVARGPMNTIQGIGSDNGLVSVRPLSESMMA